MKRFSVTDVIVGPKITNAPQTLAQFKKKVEACYPGPEWSVRSEGNTAIATSSVGEVHYVGGEVMLWIDKTYPHVFKPGTGATLSLAKLNQKQIENPEGRELP